MCMNSMGERYDRFCILNSEQFRDFLGKPSLAARGDLVEPATSTARALRISSASPIQLFGCHRRGVSKVPSRRWINADFSGEIYTIFTLLRRSKQKDSTKLYRRSPEE